MSEFNYNNKDINLNDLKDILTKEIEALNNYFTNIIKIDINDLSSSLRIKLKDFVEFIKDKEYLLSNIERENLVMQYNNTFNINNLEYNINKFSFETIYDSNNTFSYKNNIMKFINLFKQRLLKIKESLEKNKDMYKEIIANIEKDTEILNYNVNNLEKNNQIFNNSNNIINLSNNNDKETYDVNNTNLLNELDIKLNNLKNNKVNKLISIKEYKNKLIEKKETLIKKLKPFENLPTDIDLMKQIVEQKKLEYEKLVDN